MFYVYAFLVLLFLYSYYLFVKRKIPIALDGKYVIVTGAGSGFGLAITKLLLTKGCKVFALDINQEALDREYKAETNVTIIKCDVTKQDDIDQAKEIVSKTLGSSKLYSLINNAGIAHGPGSLVELPFETFRKVMDVNLFGMFRMTKTFFPFFSRKYIGFKDQSTSTQSNEPFSVVVNITSVAGLIAGPFLGPYNMSKFGGEAYSDTLRRELSPFGIRVSAIEPFFAQTNIIGFVTQKDENYEKSLFKDMMEARVDNIQNEVKLLPADLIAEKIVNDVLGNKNSPHRILIAHTAGYYVLWLGKYVLPSSILDFILVNLPERERKKKSNTKK